MDYITMQSIFSGGASSADAQKLLERESKVSLIFLVFYATDNGKKCVFCWWIHRKKKKISIQVKQPQILYTVMW